MTGYMQKILGNGSRRDGGFTLIELMIVVVIIAVLAAIAFPAYQQYAMETKRADAHATMLRISGEVFLRQQPVRDDHDRARLRGQPGGIE